MTFVFVQNYLDLKNDKGQFKSRQNSKSQKREHLKKDMDALQLSSRQKKNRKEIMDNTGQFSQSSGRASKSLNRNNRQISSQRGGLRQSQDPRNQTTDHSSRDVDSNCRSRRGHDRPGKDKDKPHKKDRTAQAIDFDKVRYPGYKELIYRKKNQE